jgi:hypothetical protein
MACRTHGCEITELDAGIEIVTLSGVIESPRGKVGGQLIRRIDPDDSQLTYTSSLPLRRSSGLF